jgi:transposase-like protein
VGVSHEEGVRMRRKVEETTTSRRARRSFTPSFKAEVVALV